MKNQLVLKELSTALQNLYMCRQFVDRLETREWVEDEHRTNSK